MPEFVAVINSPKDGKSYQSKVGGHHANSIVGKRLGEEFDGIFVGLPGFKLVLTGGSDKDGFPMRGDLPGPKRRSVLVSEGTGFHPSERGVRRRRTLCGNTVSIDTVQLNMKITTYGSPAHLEKMAKAAEQKPEK